MRLVYQKADNSYTDVYTDAKSDTKDALDDLSQVALDGNGTLVSSTKNDQTITFKELFCMSSNSDEK